jgi:hypothetical protein
MDLFYIRKNGRKANDCKECANKRNRNNAIKNKELKAKYRESSRLKLTPEEIIEEHEPENQCSNCGYKFDGRLETCPKCKVEFDWD